MDALSGMFPPWQAFLVAYAICFGLRNKCRFLERASFLDSFLDCAFCVGFHAGWMTWVLAWMASGQKPGSVILWALASASACYILDTFVNWLENGEHHV